MWGFVHVSKKPDIDSAIHFVADVGLYHLQAMQYARIFDWLWVCGVSNEVME